MNLQGCTTFVPSSPSSSSPLSASIPADGSETRTSPETPYLILYDLLALRDRMLQALNFSMSQQQNSPQQSQASDASAHAGSLELQDALTRLHAIQLSLPPHLTLSLSNFRRAKRSGSGNQLIYVLLHLVLGSLGIVGGAPSVFRCMGGSAGSGLVESVRDVSPLHSTLFACIWVHYAGTYTFFLSERTNDSRCSCHARASRRREGCDLFSLP